MTRPPFRRLLVANRGEIALRVMRACRELGIETVAVYSEADAAALHVRAADRAVAVGGAPAADSYLRADRIVAAAKATSADAIHPGYGFLSERATFAQACLDAGITFVGPAPETLTGLGDKLAARRAAAGAEVPVVPGTLQAAAVTPDATDGVVAEAERVGFPLLVKAAAGGGGRGMRRVDRATDLPAALAAASAEAAAAFGDGTVYLERHITGGRHVEVQLLGDAEGRVVALGERDCSVQRRHQKLVEEAPAPGLDAEQRRRLHALAVAVARAVGLRNAATAEFLWTDEGPWFLEVNARLQVEHGVTELVTGIDLVHEQLRIAAGLPLSERVERAAEASLHPAGHAIEVRISAEDPARSFAPTPGTLAEWREPGGPGVRVDSGVGAGSAVTGDYDPLLAKLLVHAEDRAVALARLRRALDEFLVTGLQTTLPFHRWLVDAPEFRRAELGTDFVDRHWDPVAPRRAAAERAARHAARAALEVTGDGPGSEVSLGAEVTHGWRTTGLREATDRWPA